MAKSVKWDWGYVAESIKEPAGELMPISKDGNTSFLYAAGDVSEETRNLAERICILLNKFDHIPTDELEDRVVALEPRKNLLTLEALTEKINALKYKTRDTDENT